MTDVAPPAPLPTLPAPPRGEAQPTDPFAETLDHFRDLATMLELIDRLPDLAEDIRDWRPRHPQEPALGEATPLGPVARNALDALLQGLDMLGLAAATLCENAQGRLSADERVACRDIGAAMTSLVARARALVQADAADFAGERVALYRSLLRKEQSAHLVAGKINRS